MKPDAKVEEGVIRQLQWDAQVPDPDAIGVAVKDGAAPPPPPATTSMIKMPGWRSSRSDLTSRSASRLV
jgi:hypothetical protein